MEETPVAEARAQARFVRMSPTKVRAVLDLVRGKPVAEAEAILQYVPRRAARVVAKLVRAARANAVHNLKLDEGRLFVARAFADGGPMLKRIQPHMRGQAFRVRRRMAHVTVVLRESPEEAVPARPAQPAGAGTKAEAAPEAPAAPERRRRRAEPKPKPAGAGAKAEQTKGGEGKPARGRGRRQSGGASPEAAGPAGGDGRGRSGRGRAGRKGG